MTQTSIITSKTTLANYEILGKGKKHGKNKNKQYLMKN